MLRSYVLATSAILLCASASVSCSSKSVTPAAGGARFQFNNVLEAGAPKCQAGGQVVEIAVTSTDGKTRNLVVDGSDGALVSCKATNDGFSVSVSTSQGSLIASASGSVAEGQTLSNVQMQLVRPVGFTYSTTRPTGCDVKIVTNKDNKLRAEFTCKRLDGQGAISEACSISATGAEPSYFQFSNCN